MERFITVLAWMCAIGCPIIIAFKQFLEHMYNKEGSIERLTDMMQGVRRTFPIKLQLVLFILSLVWLISM